MFFRFRHDTSTSVGFTDSSNQKSCFLLGREEQFLYTCGPYGSGVSFIGDEEEEIKEMTNFDLYWPL